MEHRVFICADRKFPHGDAGGNRIEYMAKCFLSEGYQPIVITLGSNPTEISANGINNYEGIIYKNYDIEQINTSTFDRYFKMGIKIGDILNGFQPSSDSPIIIYTSNPIFALQIKASLKKEKGIRLFYDVVEWFDKTCYKFGMFDPRFWVFEWCFYRVYSSGQGIIAISKNIKHHFEESGVNTVYFPICLDASKFDSYIKNGFDDTVKYIYPGNPQHKDDIKTMLSAINSLTELEKKKVEFHFTAVSKETIKSILGEDSFLLDELENIICFHEWMDYDDLLKLYGTMDSLLMLRFDNLVTKSNFPSKVPELLSCGVIVTANDSGDFFSFLSDGADAVKISENNESGCISAIRKLLYMEKNQRKKMSQNAIKTANNKFNYQTYAHQLVQFVVGDSKDEQ